LVFSESILNLKPVGAETSGYQAEALPTTTADHGD
jgi:hypothetical protein